MAFSVNERYRFARATVSRGHVGAEDNNEEVVVEEMVSVTENTRKFPRSK